jgi:hypothetical protein
VVGRGSSKADHKLASLASGRYVFAKEFSPEKAYPPPPPITNHYLKEFPMATFTEEFTRMRQDFDQAQTDRHQLFQDTREHVQNMAQGVKDQLTGFRQNMRDMHDEIAEMAGQVRTELHNLSTDLHTGGNIFRKGSSPKARAKKSH